MDARCLHFRLVLRFFLKWCAAGDKRSEPVDLPDADDRREATEIDLLTLVGRGGVLQDIISLAPSVALFPCRCLASAKSALMRSSWRAA